MLEIASDSAGIGIVHKSLFPLLSNPITGKDPYSPTLQSQLKVPKYNVNFRFAERGTESMEMRKLYSHFGSLDE